MVFDQQEFDIRFEWGEHGVTLLAPVSDVAIIVDVLSFSTCVEIATNRGAMIYPYLWRDERAADYALSLGAQLAAQRRTPGSFSLSPESLMDIPPGARLVLPSPNGARLSLAAGPATVLAGCLRNAEAVASVARQYGRKIAVIAAGERWKEDGSLRPSFEDLIGAGAIIDHLSGALSPEAISARAAFRGIQSDIGVWMSQCSSGKELIERGFAQDVLLASQLNVSDCAPVMINGAYVQAKPHDQANPKP